MRNTEKILDRLVKTLYAPFVPSAAFINALQKYLAPQPTVAPQIDAFLAETSEKAFSIFKKLPKNENIAKIAYVFLCLSTKKPTIHEELRSQLKLSALGFETSYFNPISLPSLRTKVGPAIFSIIHVIYSHGLIYKQLKLEQEKPCSLTHRNFMEAIVPVLREYEMAILGSDNDFLGFYGNLYCHFKAIKRFGMINNGFKDRMYLRASQDNMQHGNMQHGNMQHNNIPHSNVSIGMLDPLFDGFEGAIYKFLNDCTISYLLNGGFDDPFSEYFIRNHTLDYGLMPSFISRYTGEVIAYIGKYTAFLKSIGLLNIPKEIQEEIKKIDLSRNSAASHLKNALICVNSQLHKQFFEKFQIFDLLRFIHSTFLLGRSDFIEKLFNALKESRKTGRKSICNILENVLNSTFQKSSFNSLMDIYIIQDAPLEDITDDGEDQEMESFSLYIKLDHPISLLIEEEFVIKLVSIFKFLWKLKKIDHLSRRVGELKYFNFIQKLQFYAFNEVISNSIFEFPDYETFCFDIFKKSINRKLDDIMKGLFISTKDRKIELMLYYLERHLVNKGMSGGMIDDLKLTKAMREFYEIAKRHLTGTYLFNMEEYL